jgi:hypothetical protein
MEKQVAVPDVRSGWRFASSDNSALAGGVWPGVVVKFDVAEKATDSSNQNAFR